MKVVFCTLHLTERPHPAFIQSLQDCLPAVETAGFTHQFVSEIGCPYISGARAKVLRKALDGLADIVVYLDYDVSWSPEDMIKLLTTDGEVVAGTYRVKRDNEVKYMGIMKADEKGLVTRADGCISAEKVPAGFLKITREALTAFAFQYPELLFGDPLAYSLDLFNHGAINNIWHGEDYAFSHRWKAMGKDIWLIPNLNINHHKGDEVYEGNFHKYLMEFNDAKAVS